MYDDIYEKVEFQSHEKHAREKGRESGKGQHKIVAIWDGERPQLINCGNKRAYKQLARVLIYNRKVIIYYVKRDEKIATLLTERIACYW